MRQDDALATATVNVVLEKATKNIETNLTGTIVNRTRQHVARADGVLIVGQSVRATEGAVVDQPLGTVRPAYRTGVSLLSRERFLYI